MNRINTPTNKKIRKQTIKKNWFTKHPLNIKHKHLKKKEEIEK